MWCLHNVTLSRGLRYDVLERQYLKTDMSLRTVIHCARTYTFYMIEH